MTNENGYDSLALKQIVSLLNVSAKIQDRSTSKYSSAASLTTDEIIQRLEARRSTIEGCREMGLSQGKILLLNSTIEGRSIIL